MNRIKPFLIILLLVVVGIGVFVVITNTSKETSIIPDQKKIGLELAQENKSAVSTVKWLGNLHNEVTGKKAVLEMINEFEFLNQSIQIEINSTSDILEENKRIEMAELITRMITNENYKWDIFWLDDIIYQHVADNLGNQDWGKKYLVDFSLIYEFKESHKQFILDDEFHRNKTGGIATGPFIGGTYYVLWYNSSLAEKIGIHIKKFGMTIDDLIDYTRAVKDYNEKYKTNYAAFFETNDKLLTSLLFQSLYFSEIQDPAILESDELSGIKREALLKALMVFEDLGELSPLIESHYKNSYEQSMAAILDNDALFYPSGSYMYGIWKQKSNKYEKMRPAELPVFKPMPFYPGLYTSNWAVFKNSTNRDHAEKILKFLMSEKMAMKWENYTKSPTGLKGEKNTFLAENNVYDNFNNHIARKYNNNFRFYSNSSFIFGKNAENFMPIVEENLRNLLIGNISAEDAYNNILVNANID